VNFIKRLALQEKKKINDSSRLDVVEIAHVPDVLAGWAKKILLLQNL
jgi:hypothetical protein